MADSGSGVREKQFRRQRAPTVILEARQTSSGVHDFTMCPAAQGVQTFSVPRTISPDTCIVHFFPWTLHNPSFVCLKMFPENSYRRSAWDR